MNIYRLHNIKVYIDNMIYTFFIIILFFISCISIYNYIEYSYSSRKEYINNLEVVETNNYIYKPNRLDMKDYIYYYIIQFGSIDDYIEVEK